MINIMTLDFFLLQGNKIAVEPFVLLLSKNIYQIYITQV